MKRINYLMLITAIAFGSASVFSQIGNLKRIVKDKTTTEKEKPAETKPQGDQSKPTAGLNTDSTMRTQAQAGFDPKYPPGVQFSSLLSEVILHPNGNLAIEITATFLPPAKSEKILEPYNEVDGGNLEGVIKKADGSVHYRKRFRGKPLSGPYWRIFPAGTGFVQMTPGDYVLELLVEGKLFYRFPFSVVNEGAGDDPFARGAGDKMVMKGAWNEYGYLHLTDGNPASTLSFRMWLRAPAKKTADISVAILRDGKVVASGGSGRQTIDLPIRWERRDIGLERPNGSIAHGTDIFGQDGNYKVVVKLDGKLYGEYPFTIKDKKFVYLPEQTRGETDMTMFVEGGNDAFYVKKAK